MTTNEKLIFMTGGGTAGHITPNLALRQALEKEGFQVEYLGRKDSMEYQLVTKAGIPFLTMNSGRINRSLEPKLLLETLLLPGRVIQGIFQAVRWIKKKHPALIFCKGGFVSFPAAVAGRLTKTPVVLHESDLTPGLANKMCIPFSNVLCTTFEETLQYLPKGKAVYTGSPIRQELSEGVKSRGFQLTGLNEDGKPVLLIVGGSQGAKAINDAVKESLPQILEKFQVVHLYGNKSGYEPPKVEGYCPLAYAGEELKDLYAMADLILGRAGANSINEFLLLKIPSVLVPLPLDASRGDQILNAKNFEKNGFSFLLLQEEMSQETLLHALTTVYDHRQEYIAAMEGAGKNGVSEVVRVIKETIGTK